jgi:uncharacterized protein (TIGR03437 family)
MRSLFRSVGLVVVLVGFMAGQTAIVQNAAVNVSGSIGYPILVNGIGIESQLIEQVVSRSDTVSPGMLATLSARATRISIRPSGSDTPIRTEIASFTPGTTNFIVPRNMPLGGAEIEYQTEGQPTGWTNVNVVAASFEFFRIGRGGPAVAQTVGPGGSLSPIGLTTPAQPGQTILLTGSGLGNAHFTVTVGGVPASVIAAAPHRAHPGADEILIQIPSGANVPDGCYVPLVLTYNSTAVTSTISKTSNGAACVHPFQLSSADMKTLDGGGSIAVGQISMGTTLQVATPTAASRMETASIQFSPMAAADIAAFFAPSQNPPGCQALVAPGVIAFSYLSGDLFSLFPLINVGPSVSLQNGANALSLTGPGFYSAMLPQPAQGPLTNPPPPAIAGGKWTWSSAGGPDLAASSFGFNLPAPFQLSGSGLVSLNRNVDQTLTWNGAAFDSGAMLNAFLPGNVNCTMPANSGNLTIPATLLSQVPAGSLGPLSITVTESGSYMPHAQFRLQNGNTLLMLVNYSTGEATSVDVQ